IAGCAHRDEPRAPARAVSLQYLCVSARPYRILLIEGGGSRIDFGDFRSGSFKTEETFFFPVIAADVDRVIRVLATIDQSAFDNAYGAPSLPKDSFEHGTGLV